MAWPFSRLTTYVASTTPSIKAFDLNEMQDAIVALYGFPPIFGDGSDGAYAQAAGVIDLTSNKYYTTVSLTGTAHLRPVSHIIHANEYIRLRDTSEIGARGTTATAQPGGAPGGGANQTLGQGGAGGGGGTGGVNQPGSAGTSRTETSMGGSGGVGGSVAGGGGAGGAGGVASLNEQLESRTIVALLTGMLLGYNGTSYGSFPVQGGGGGGGGGQAGATDGGGGGGAGGPIILCAPVIDIGAGCFVRTTGGDGGPETGGSGNGSGGGGGGGPIILICTQLIEDGTISAAGGVTGAGAVGGASGVAGTIIRKILFP